MDRTESPAAVESYDKVKRKSVMLAFDRVGLSYQSFLSFFASVSKISSQSLSLRNEGETAVYFEWKKHKPKIPFDFEIEDHADYFHIHNVRSNNMRGKKLSDRVKQEYLPSLSSRNYQASSTLNTI